MPRERSRCGWGRARSPTSGASPSRPTRPPPRSERAGAMSETRPRWSVAPYFVVDDVVATAAFYRDKLGFAYERFWGDPPGFTMVHRSGVVLMLGQLAPTGTGSLMRPNG